MLYGILVNVERPKFKLLLSKEHLMLNKRKKNEYANLESISNGNFRGYINLCTLFLQIRLYVFGLIQADLQEIMQ